MRKTFPTDFVFQIFALLIAFIIVHTIYVAEIRPTADVFLAQEHARMRSDKNYLPERSMYVVLRDYEQESCFVLMLWAMAILSYKGVGIHRHQRQLSWDFIGLPEDARISVETARDLAHRIRREIPDKLQEYTLPAILLSALDRFTTTTSIQDASLVVHSMCESEAERSESELSIIRYIAWAIPSIGFIGTVRGIGDALAQANQAVHGDITGVTQSLGVAFNSTLIALLISIVLMFVIHQIQLMQERLVLGAERYCESMLISRLKI
jgi:biopolymer transport protein ExbB/TolQ